MDILREQFDRFYESQRDRIFKRTKDNPKKAHAWFAKLARIIYTLKLEKLILDNESNHLNPSFTISNAAGFNKDAQIPPTFLRYLGFDRVVVGTVTYNPWSGNSGKTIERYPETESMVNWEGLPGVGAQEVRQTLLSYKRHEIPITINLMSTPQKQGDEMLEDIANTIRTLRDIPYIDRWELNISCPNTKPLSGETDARKEYQNNLNDMLKILNKNAYYHQEKFVKISPDTDESGAKDILDVVRHHVAQGLTIPNTTTQHDPRLITHKPNPEGRGGASGNAVYEKAKAVQETFLRLIDEKSLPYEVIAVGGINSVKRARERTSHPRVKGIQVYTPLIFKGPRLLRELRTA